MNQASIYLILVLYLMVIPSFAVAQSTPNASTNPQPKVDQPGPLEVEEFELLFKILNPPKEKWETIDWHSNLVSAQRDAARQSKPIFIWAMDGHPLGCT